MEDQRERRRTIRRGVLGCLGGGFLFATLTLAAGFVLLVRACEGVGDLGDDSDPRTLAALDPETGDILWRRGFEGGGTLLFGVIFEETAIITDPEGDLRALDLRDGADRWVTPITSDAASAPILADSVVYILAGDQSLLAVDAATGDQRWRVEDAVDGTPFSLVDGLADSDPVGYGLVIAGPTVATAGQGDSVVRLFERVTGAPLATVQLGGGVGRPVAVGDTIVVVDSTQMASAFAAPTGSTLWTRPAGGVSRDAVAAGPVVGLPQVERPRGPEVVFVDPATGAERWRGQPPFLGAGSSTFDPVSGLLYEASISGLVARDPATGVVRETLTMTAADEVVISEVIVLGGLGPDIEALRAPNGPALWSRSDLGQEPTPVGAGPGAILVTLDTADA